MAALRKYRQGRYSEKEILEDYRMQLVSVETAKEKGTFKEMWQGTNLKRSLIVIGVNIFSQISGSSFVTRYSTIFIKQVGALDPFEVTVINTGLVIVVVLVCMYLTDKAGRRSMPMLLRQPDYTNLT